MTTLYQPIHRLTLLIGGVLLLIVILYSHFVSADVALYIEMGEKLLDGQRPYVDYEEINLPMVHFLSTVPALLGRLTGVPAHLFVHVFVFALLGVSVWTSHVLTRRMEQPLAGYLIGLCLVLMALNQYLFNDWGQREHLFALSFIPWILLRILRRSDNAPTGGIAFALGVWVGIGVSLKPYFVIIAVGVELLGLVRTRRWAIWTPEVGGVMLVAALHGLYFVLNPDVLVGLVEVLGHVQAGYGAYPSASVLRIFQVLTVWFSTFILVLMNLLVLRIGFSPKFPKEIFIVLQAFTVLGLLTYMMQGKGWGYHAVPFYTGITITVGLLIGNQLQTIAIQKPDRTTRLMRWITVVLPLLSLYYAVTLINNSHTEGSMVSTGFWRLSGYIHTYSASGNRIMVVDTNPDSAYPLLPINQRRHASRYAVAHPIGFAYYRYNGLPYEDPAHVVPVYAQTYLDHFVEDMRTHKPPLVIIRDSQCSACSLYLQSLHDYLAARGILAEVIEPDYDLLAVDKDFRIYVRKGITPNP
ncbi:MAG: hypothetical protein MUF38_18290 [Anaerolineae bacterium]|nr:hypothetical protein [Anaerolineae bacterium]